MMKYNEQIENEWGPSGIKLLNDHTVIKHATISGRDAFKCIQSICHHFINRPDPMVVPVYSFEVVHAPDGHFGMFMYEYTMKRLGMLDRGEMSYIYIDKKERTSYPMRQDEKEELERLKDIYPALVKFMDVIWSQKRYGDIHDHNFLKDEEDNYRVIDLEGFIRFPFDREENDWITR